MKKKNYILFIVVLLISLRIYSQNYQPMIQEGNQWNELYLYGMGPNEHYKTEVKKIMGDSIIDGIKYKKLMYTRDNEAKNWELWGLMREDSKEKKIYIKEGERPESLFFDFSLKEGESIIIDAPFPPNNIKVDIRVESIGEILIKDELRRTLTIRSKLINDSYEGDSRVWIEGIGSSDGLFEGLLPSRPGAKISLLCFFQRDNLIFKPTSEFEECFYWTTSIDKTEQDSPISFDIEDNILNVSVQENNPFSVELYDIQGICLKKITNSYNSAKIDLSFSNQLYLLKVVYKGDAKVIKFIK